MFMAYAKSTWDMSNRHANRLIAASCVIDKIRPRGRVLKRIASRSGTSHAETRTTWWMRQRSSIMWTIVHKNLPLNTISGSWKISKVPVVGFTYQVLEIRVRSLLTVLYCSQEFEWKRLCSRFLLEMRRSPCEKMVGWDVSMTEDLFPDALRRHLWGWQGRFMEPNVIVMRISNVRLRTCING